MKYIKTYENNKPKIGDYIITNKNASYYKPDDILFKIATFINNNIGVIIGETETSYIVQYNNIPRNLLRFFNHSKTSENETQYKNYRYIHPKDILAFSDNIQDLNILRKANKFNI